MRVDEFEQQFDGKTRELIVRISWCWTKDSPVFSREDGLCHARARFDQAIDVHTDAVIGKGLFNWLEWLTPKRPIGHPYGFAFKKGHLYRLLVRASRENEDDGNTFRYQILQMLESDVKESRLDPYLQFSGGYEDEDIERVLLVEGGPYGWANFFDYRRLAVRYLALAEGHTDEPRAVRGSLRWMERDTPLTPKTHFKELGIYQVRVREGKEDPSSLMLVKVVRRLHDARFDALREEYLRPVAIEHALGNFTLNRRYSWYEGSVDYLGEPVDVLLNVEEGSTDVSVPLARLEEVCANLASVDRRVREYAADEMMEYAVDWCDEELTRDMFIARMKNPSMNIGSDGSIEFMYDDGGMFAGHVIVVSMEPDGTFSDAGIEG